MRSTNTLSCKTFNFTISVDVSGYDTAWILGDNFATRTYRIGFKKGCGDDTFLKKNFEVKNFISSRYSDNERNFLKRVCDTFAGTLKKYSKLPKLLVVVLEDDLIDELNCKGSNLAVSTFLGLWFDWLVRELDDMIETRKVQLPTKAKRMNYPQVFWLAPSHHALFSNSKLRTKLSLCMLSSIKKFEYMRLIKLKEIWEFEDETTVLDPAGALTLTGMVKYWRSVSASVQFNWDKFIMKKKQPSTTSTKQEVQQDPMYNVFQKNKNFFNKRNTPNDKFH